MSTLAIRKNWGLVLGTLVFLSLSLLNIRSTHEWGDDFAMYIHQAKNIVEGIPQTENGYFYSPATHYYGPKAYSVGFPLFLAPVYALFGNSIYHFEFAISLLAFTFALLSWRFLFLLTGNLFLSFVFVLTLIANPWFIEFKGNVLSDIPYASLALGITLLMPKNKLISIKTALVIGLLLGWALLTRSIGITLWLAIAASFAVTLFTERKSKVERLTLVKSGAAILASSAVVFLLFQFVLFPAPTLGSYAYSIDLLGMLKAVSRTADYYIQITRDLIPNAGPIIIQTVLFHFVIVGVIFGFLVQIRRKIRFEEWLFFLYFCLLFIWPGLQGFRLLLPIVPFALAYLYIASDRVWPGWAKKPSAVWVSGLILFATVYPFAHPVIGIQKRIYAAQDGPQAPEAAEAFHYIQENLPKDAITSFRKARAFSLYTERNAISDPTGSDEDIIAHFRTMKAKYALIDSKYTEKTFLTAVTRIGTPIWKNTRFELYRFPL